MLTRSALIIHHRTAGRTASLPLSGKLLEISYIEISYTIGVLAITAPERVANVEPILHDHRSESCGGFFGSQLAPGWLGGADKGAG